MRRVTTVLLATGVLATSGCQDAIAPAPGTPLFDIQDASHGNGAPHFYWSTPIVRVAGSGGVFDGSYQPVVQVCEWNGSACVATVAEFRTGRGSGDVIRVDVAGERYHVNWNTGQCRSGACALDPARRYRIRVLVAGLEAGFADVDVVSSRAEAKRLDVDGYVPLVNGTTLPIRFRLERGLTLVNRDASALPPLRRARERYRHEGVRPGTARDGSAVLQGRALLSANGTTLIELTTGNFDVPSTPPGNIEKVQFRHLNASGEPTYTLNFNGLSSGGAWSHMFEGMPRGAQLHLQASISGIDANRTNVVTVPLTVARRPDLVAKDLALPATATPGAPTVISATVAEQNGDAGATGDCRLYVNGAVADEAPGIWVDAGDEVTCQFAVTFSQAGTYAVRVAVENVAPADDDGSNNDVAGSISIALSNSTNVYNDAGATFREYSGYREAWSFRQQTTRTDDPTYLLLEEYGEVRETEGRTLSSWHQWSSNTTGLGNELAFPLASVKVLQRSGDVVLADYTLTDLPATYTASWDDGSRRSCHEGAAPAGQSGWFRVCTAVELYQPWGQPAQTVSRSWVYADASRGRVQYFSRSFYRFVYSPFGEEYGYESLYMEEEVGGDGTVGEPGAEMSWVFDVQGVHASTGEPLRYTAHLTEPWRRNVTETFDGVERCDMSRWVFDVFVQEYGFCSTQLGAYRFMDVFKSLRP